MNSYRIRNLIKDLQASLSFFRTTKTTGFWFVIQLERMFSFTLTTWKTQGSLGSNWSWGQTDLATQVIVEWSPRISASNSRSTFPSRNLLTRADMARASKLLISSWTISKGYWNLPRKRFPQDTKIPYLRITLNLLASIIPESKLQITLILKTQRVPLGFKPKWKKRRRRMRKLSKA